MAGEVSGSSSEEMGPISAINVTPFVDVVLVLLVIFMVTAPALMKDTLGIRLPKASSASQSAPQSFGLAVNRMGQFLLNGQVATEEEVVAEARAQVSRNSGFQVIISADGEARHQSVVRAIDLVKSAGVTQFALQIQRQEQ